MKDFNPLIDHRRRNYIADADIREQQDNKK